MIFFIYGRNITSIAIGDPKHRLPISPVDSCPINAQRDISYGAYVVPVIYPDTRLSAMLHILQLFPIARCAYQV